MSNAITIVTDVQAAIAEAQARKGVVAALYTQKILEPNIDYGAIAGTDKPTLLKPGAERLCSAFGLSPLFELIEKVEQWDDDAPLFHYQYRCHLVHIASGQTIATGVGSCNSKEKKYRWRWLYRNEVDALGLNPDDLYSEERKSKKNNSRYRVYRVPNTEVFDIVNTIDKMAQKRALIAAVLIGCNASQFFTQDVEDMAQFAVEPDVVIDAAPAEPPPPAPRKGKASGTPGWASVLNLQQIQYRLKANNINATLQDMATAVGIEHHEDYDAWQKKFPTLHDASVAIWQYFNGDPLFKVD